MCGAEEKLWKELIARIPPEVSFGDFNSCFYEPYPPDGAHELRGNGLKIGE
jgi:hypothetical protein